MKRKSISLQSWLRRYWFAMLAILLVSYFILQAFTMTMLTERKEDSVRREIQVAGVGIEQALSVVDSFVNEALYSGVTQTPSELYNTLRYETDPIALAGAKSTAVQIMQSMVSWSDMIEFAMLYTPRDDRSIWLEVGSESSFIDRGEVKRLILDAVTQGSQRDIWSRYLVGETTSGSQLMRVIRVKDGCLVVGVSAREIIRTLQPGEGDGHIVAFVAQQDGGVIFASQEIDRPISGEQDGQYVTVNGIRYLQTGGISESAGLYFGMLTEREEIMADLWIFRVLFLVMLCVLLLVIPASFAVIVRGVGKPIREISGTMDRVAEGDLDLTVEDGYPIDELRRLARAFDHMIAQVKELKIEKYEEQLKAQRATMQYLQLQIKPHFFVNMLNIVYALAEQRDYATIQKVSQAVVAYSRYMFRDASELVELQREIDHVSHYMDIQQIRYNTQIVCRLDIAEHTLSALVPPFVIQSFVENSVKYALSMSRVCEIDIHVDTDPGRDRLEIEIRDNGEGYSRELLEKSWEEKDEDGHIGLSNIYQRLELIYNDKADIRLENDHGAVTRIRVPYISLDADSVDFEEPL